MTADQPLSENSMARAGVEIKSEGWFLAFFSLSLVSVLWEFGNGLMPSLEKKRKKKSIHATRVVIGQD